MVEERVVSGEALACLPAEVEAAELRVGSLDFSTTRRPWTLWSKPPRPASSRSSVSHRRARTGGARCRAPGRWPRRASRSRPSMPAIERAICMTSMVCVMRVR